MLMFFSSFYKNIVSSYILLMSLNIFCHYYQFIMFIIDLDDQGHNRDF